MPSTSSLTAPTDHPHPRRTAFALALAALLGWGLLAHQVATGGPVVRLDDAVAQWAHAAAGPGLIGAFLALSVLHTLPPLMAAAAVIGGLLWRRGERVWSWLLPVALLGGACLNMALKEAFQRQRPAFSGLAAELHSYSFPSGHAAHATVFYGLLALLAWQGLRHRPGWRGLATGAALLTAALVMAARVVLGVHYLADVLAGLLVGIAWLGVLLAILLPAPMRPFGLKR